MPAGPSGPSPPPGDEAQLPPDDHIPCGLGPALRTAGPGSLQPAPPLPRPLRPAGLPSHRAIPLPGHSGYCISLDIVNCTHEHWVMIKCVLYFFFKFFN